ncbi:MAG: hypothetical protein Q8934_22520 [Bacillota bacterium]|nr:hypothetical protein [Bacillota bacterium]
MAKYRRIPFDIEAIQLKEDNFAEVDAFITEPHRVFEEYKVICIDTPYGTKDAVPGDYIVKNQELFFPYKADDFNRDFERVE